MKTAIFGVLLLLSGCATTAVPPEWEPDSLKPKTVTLHFLDREEWVAFQAERKNCEPDCDFIAEQFGGTAYWIDGPDNATDKHCHIYYPAHKGIPSHRLFVHELRHCYQGAHSEWTN